MRHCNLLHHLFDAEIRHTDLVYDDRAILSKQMQDLADVLRAKGHKPYVLLPWQTMPLGLVGYVCLAGEICNQLQERGLSAQYLFLACGSGQTQAGLTLGAKYFGAPFQVIGVTPTRRQSREEMARTVADLANETAKFLEMNLTLEPDEIVIHGEYASEEQSPTRGSIEAIKLVAQTEGIFLDPLYTGKAMAALVDQTQQGKIKPSDAVIFYHTGGLPAIFEYSEAFLQGL